MKFSSNNKYFYIKTQEKLLNILNKKEFIKIIDLKKNIYIYNNISQIAENSLFIETKLE